MTSPYRENQHVKDPFDVLDHNALRQKAYEHKILLRKTALQLCQNISLKDALEKVKGSLTKAGSAWINPIEIVRYDRRGYMSEEESEIDQTIISWFVEKFELKGFDVKCRYPHLLISFCKE